jgi:hypothetical protein
MWPNGLEKRALRPEKETHGWVAEWFKAPVLKTGDVKASVGSNPTPSAIRYFIPELATGANPLAGPMTDGQDPERATNGAGASKTAIRVLALVLALAGLWVARAFLLQIGFAVILVVAIWPLYRRLERRAVRPERKLFLPLAFTLAVGAILLLPFVVFAAEAVRDSDGVAR